MIIYEVQLNVERHLSGDETTNDIIYFLVAARNGREALVKCKAFEQIPGCKIGTIETVKIDQL